MFKCSWLFVILLVVFCACCGGSNLLRFLQLSGHDGMARVCALDAENFANILEDVGKVTVVVASDSEGACLRENMEILAQVLATRNVRVCKATTQLFNLNSQTAGHRQVLIYRAGKKTEYHGQFSPAALLSYLVKLNSTQVKLISGKLDKVAFDAIQQPKVVGLFMDATPDYKAFEEAAALLSPGVLFYATFDRTVAKYLKIDAVGQVHFYKPLQKTAFPCPTNPASVLDLQACVNENKGAFLTKLTEHNIKDPQVLGDASRTVVLAIGEQASPLGGYVHRLLSKTIRNNTNNTEFQRLNILWVEPDLFPAVHLNVDPSGVPLPLPRLGAVNETTSTWFDLTLLNTTADKIADEQNVLLLQTWLRAVLNNTLAPSAGIQSFKTQPASRTVAEGSTFVLECQVAHPVGDCLWLHNGQNLGFNMARYGGQFAWAGDQLTGDCSLRVVGALVGHHDGQWVCEMTGNSGNPTITSATAQIIVTADGLDPKVEL